MTRDIMLVDAFTTTPFTGNAAAVLLDASDLEPVIMQRIAREMNVSETAFVLPSDQADLRLRWFTPETEVPLCGHATIATFHALVETGKLAVPNTYTLETKVGILDVELTNADNAPCTVWLDVPIPEFAESSMSLTSLTAAFRIDESELLEDIPPTIGGEYLYVGLHNLTTLLSLKPDFSHLRLLSRTDNLSGFVLYTLSGLDETSRVHVRFFAPAWGIDEDPVTGSAHAPLGALLVGVGVIPTVDGGRVVQYYAEQGDAIHRAGRVRVEVTLDEDDHPIRSRVGGSAITVMRGKLRA